MSIITTVKSALGLSSSDDEASVSVDDREVGEELEQLIKSEFHVESLEKDFTIGDESEHERTEFKFVWSDTRGDEYALTVATDTAYGGYAVEYKVAGRDDFTLREEPADEVVETLRGVFR